MRAVVRAVALLVLVLVSACAPAMTRYVPQVVAKDELTVSYDGRFTISQRGEPVARGLTFAGLTDRVRCVPKAAEHAAAAERAGKRALAFSIIGGVLGGLSLGAFAAFASPRTDVRLGVLFGGVGVAAIGTVFAALGVKDKNAANGNAIDAMNYFNDAAGSLGDGCDDPASSFSTASPSSP